MGIMTVAGLLETALDRADERATLVCVNEVKLRSDPANTGCIGQKIKALDASRKALHPETNDSSS